MKINQSWLCVSPITKIFSLCQKYQVPGSYISHYSKIDFRKTNSAPGFLTSYEYGLCATSSGVVSGLALGFCGLSTGFGVRGKEKAPYFPVAVPCCAMEMQGMGEPWALHPTLQWHLSSFTISPAPGFNDFKALINLTSSRRWTSMANLYLQNVSDWRASQPPL